MPRGSNQPIVLPRSRAVKWPGRRPVSLGTSAAVSANGRVAILGTSRRIVGGYVHPTAEVFTWKAGKWTGPVGLHLGTILYEGRIALSVALNADGKTALVGDWEYKASGTVYGGTGFVFTSSL